MDAMFKYQLVDPPGRPKEDELTKLIRRHVRKVLEQNFNRMVLEAIIQPIPKFEGPYEYLGHPEQLPPIVRDPKVKDRMFSVHYGVRNPVFDFKCDV